MGQTAVFVDAANGDRPIHAVPLAHEKCTRVNFMLTQRQTYASL